MNIVEASLTALSFAPVGFCINIPHIEPRKLVNASLSCRFPIETEDFGTMINIKRVG